MVRIKITPTLSKMDENKDISSESGDKDKSEAPENPGTSKEDTEEVVVLESDDEKEEKVEVQKNDEPQKLPEKDSTEDQPTEDPPIVAEDPLNVVPVDEDVEMVEDIDLNKDIDSIMAELVKEIPPPPADDSTKSPEKTPEKESEIIIDEDIELVTEEDPLKVDETDKIGKGPIEETPGESENPLEDIILIEEDTAENETKEIVNKNSEENKEIENKEETEEEADITVKEDANKGEDTTINDKKETEKSDKQDSEENDKDLKETDKKSSKEIDNDKVAEKETITENDKNEKEDKTSEEASQLPSEDVEMKELEDISVSKEATAPVIEDEFDLICTNPLELEEKSNSPDKDIDQEDDNSNSVEFVQSDTNGSSSSNSKLSTKQRRWQNNVEKLLQEGNLNNFNPESSVREKKKLRSKASNKTSAVKKAVKYYDGKGIFIETKMDLCDCLQEDCPGCFFPCRTCQGPKCGNKCRAHRTWTYMRVTYDGHTEPTVNPCLMKSKIDLE